MRRPALLSLIALALCLPGCSSATDPAPMSTCEPGVAYAIGTSVHGKIEATDCPDPSGSGFVDYHEFDLEVESPVTAVISTLVMPGPMYVALLDGAGNMVDSTALYPGGYATVGGLLPKGTYTLAIGMSPGNEGSYTISSYHELPGSGRPWYGCTEWLPYTVGTEVAEALTIGDCFAGESYWDFHRFTIESRTTIRVDLRTRWFISEIHVFDAEGFRIAQGLRYVVRNDQNLRDSYLEVSLPPGTYSIGVASFLYRDKGSYTLSTRKLE